MEYSVEDNIEHQEEQHSTYNFIKKTLTKYAVKRYFSFKFQKGKNPVGFFCDNFCQRENVHKILCILIERHNSSNHLLGVADKITVEANSIFFL